ncbi:MAG: hypothetical protein B6229_07060 [Spirochaetaceae bacterium 4572_7]|nr:MAG: hypothetical protein B6229_07060 [Spirochaetaceae bacterium 4572_7]
MKKILSIILFILYIFPISAEDKVLNISVSSLDLTLNPFYAYTTTEAQYLSGIYEGLVSYNPKDLSPQPALAESWTLSDDKKTYTFTLRDDIFFDDGEKITSTTFRDSFIKLLTPGTKAEFASLLNIVKNAQKYRTKEITDSSLIGITTNGDKKLIITLEKRAPYFTKILCHHSFTPVPKELLNKKIWQFGEQQSSGPYVLKKYNDKIILSKNKKYWDKNNVYFDTINLLLYRDTDTATKDYNQGKIDWMTGNTINLDKVSDLNTLKVNPLFGTTYYYFNTTYKEYSDPEIRNAISLLVPWNKIRENQYIPAKSLVPTLPDFPQNSVESATNIEKAKEILKKKGYNNGKGISNLIISIPENAYNDDLIATLIKKSVEDNTEIKVEIKKVKYPEFFTINRTEPFTISTLSWIGDFADPLTFLEMWTSNSSYSYKPHSRYKCY